MVSEVDIILTLGRIKMKLLMFYDKHESLSSTTNSGRNPKIS